MLHEPAAKSGKDPAFKLKSKLGVKLLGVYALIYVVFIAINVVKPSLMETTVFAGLNLAVVYGFGLIIVALIMALVYSAVCTRLENAMSGIGEVK